MMVMMMVGEIIVLESAAAAAAAPSSPSLQPTPSTMKLPNESVVKHKRRKRKRRKQREENHSSLSIENNASSLLPSSSIIEDNTTKTTEEEIVVVNSLQGVHNTTATALNNEICNNSDHELTKNATNVEKKNKKKRTTPIKKPKKKNASKKVTTTSSSTGKGGECLRRIKHEWRDAVRTGIAYDWINHKTIRNTSTSSSAYVRIGPFGKNLLRWHFSVCGPANSVYENGIYHGRVLLPPNYPASPPRIQMITPSGRFIPGEDICLSASSYHPETWTPRWTVLSLVDALRLHMLTTANEIGGVLATDDKRKEYALQSRSWKFNGIANHEKMVAEGIFTMHTDSGQLKEEDGEKNNEGKISSSADESTANKLCEMATHEECTTSNNTEQYAGRDLSHHNNASIDEKAVVPPTKKKAKKRKKKSMTTNLGDESSSNTTSKTEGKKRKPIKKGRRQRKSTADYHDSIPTMQHFEANKEALSNEDVESRSNNNSSNNIVTVMLKRLLIEILKVPLRVLATLLRILDSTHF
jgi:ubiquitin-protein ligase